MSTHEPVLFQVDGKNTHFYLNSIKGSHIEIVDSITHWTFTNNIRLLKFYK